MNGLSCLSLSLACVNKIAYNLYENFALASNQIIDYITEKAQPHEEWTKSCQYCRNLFVFNMAAYLLSPTLANLQNARGVKSCFLHSAFSNHLIHPIITLTAPHYPYSSQTTEYKTLQKCKSSEARKLRPSRSAPSAPRLEGTVPALSGAYFWLR